jgi:hypothetical protein
MTVTEPPREQPPEDDPALLTTALNHAWAWYDGRSNNALQVLNYYLVATAVLFTAYTSAINGKHYGIAAASALTGLGLTALAFLVGIHEVHGAALAEDALVDLQKRIADMLSLDTICMARSQAGRTRQRRAAIAIAGTLGLVTLFDISALLYALIQ